MTSVAAHFLLVCQSVAGVGVGSPVLGCYKGM
ncbi:hypothetical protein GDO81_022179 [Engystomops pustulosus]|uniref:Uncharacterized protein n=1 Tax=Engystomops pustulosus TaxID=76066 RepID=A0AAV6Z4T5_ENGPU|nr:hypothetical protein GDO81_022179 [Engystomops pustulosus]